MRPLELLTVHVEISGSPAAFARSLRTYAEYRAFVRLTPIADTVRVVRIDIRRHAEDDATSCLILADLGAAGSRRARSKAAEPTKAIDVAVRRLEAKIQRSLLRRNGDAP